MSLNPRFVFDSNNRSKPTEANRTQIHRLSVSSILISESITNNESTIIGIITKTDVIRRSPSLSRKEYKVSDFMTDDVYTVVPSAILHEAMLFMVDGNVSRVVVTEKRKPVGIITMHDLLPVGTFVNPFFNQFENDEFTLASKPTTTTPFPSGVRAKLVHLIL